MHRAWLTSDVASGFNESIYYPYTSLKYHTLIVAALLVDILLRVTAAESHGTAPLNWEWQGCRLPSQHTVGIGE